MRFYQRCKIIISMLYICGMVLLSACSDNESDSIKNITNYSFTLDSKQVPVLPAISSSATGSAELSLEKESGALSGSITLSNNITATAAHIHMAAVGATGAVIISFAQNSTDMHRFDIPANTLLTATQLDELKAGNYYINVHTATNPAGELRGQILSSDQSVLVTELSTAQIPSLTVITSTGQARGFSLVNNSDGSLSGVVRLSGITPTAMHIHSGYLGTSGSAIITLTQSSDPDIWDIPASSKLSGAQLTDLNNGKLYYNIHTTANTSGELHGQIGTGDLKFYVLPLAANPNVTTTATGVAFVSANIATGLLNTNVLTSGISITNMHMHDNTNSGAIVKALTATTDVTIWNVSNAMLSTAEITALLAGNYYVNVHSSQNPTGELTATIQ